MSSRLRSLVAIAALCGPAWLGCSGTNIPTGPGNTITVTTVNVGVPGNGSSSLAPGDTRQLFATATQSDGTTVDVTNLATWQSSAPNVATVSPSGVVTAAAEGAVDVNATYKTVKGTLHVNISPTCTVSVSPSTATYTAFGGTATVNVTVNSASCRWTVQSDAAWLPLTMDPATGSGALTYTAPANSTVSARTATVTVSTSNGATATHSIVEDRPLGCSYVTQPGEITYTAAGGTGQFTVIATPSDCRWTVVNSMSALGVSVSSDSGGTGNGQVRYTVQSHTRTVDADGYIEIAGLSGLNPNGRHHIILLKR